MRRLYVAVAAMIVVLSTGFLTLSPAAQGEGPSPLRLILSIALLFGVAFLGAALALTFQGADDDRRRS